MSLHVCLCRCLCVGVPVCTPVGVPVSPRFPGRNASLKGQRKRELLHFHVWRHSKSKQTNPVVSLSSLHFSSLPLSLAHVCGFSAAQARQYSDDSMDGVSERKGNLESGGKHPEQQEDRVAGTRITLCSARSAARCRTQRGCSVPVRARTRTRVSVTLPLFTISFKQASEALHGYLAALGMIAHEQQLQFSWPRHISTSPLSLSPSIIDFATTLLSVCFLCCPYMCGGTLACGDLGRFPLVPTFHSAVPKRTHTHPHRHTHTHAHKQPLLMLSRRLWVCLLASPPGTSPSRPPFAVFLTFYSFSRHLHFLRGLTSLFSFP